LDLFFIKLSSEAPLDKLIQYILVTRGIADIGKITAVALAKKGARIIIARRKTSKCAKALAQFKKKVFQLAKRSIASLTIYPRLYMHLSTNRELYLNLCE